MNNYPPNSPQLGNLSHTVTISLEEAAAGKTVSLIIPREDICEKCSGTGQSWRDDDGTCSNCNNKGLVRYEKRFEVLIPAGVNTGSRLRIAGEGNLESAQAVRGDLYIVINVGRHELFERKGKDLYSFFRLTKEEMKSGAEVIVPTLLDGQKRLRIPPKMTDGSLLRMAGLGLRSLESAERGDLYVKVGTEPAQRPVREPSSASFVPPPQTRQPSRVKEFFLGHAKSLTIVAGFLLVVGIIYLNNHRSSPGVSSTSNSPTANNSTVAFSPSAQPTITYSPPPTPAASPVRLPVSLTSGANIIPPQGPRGDMMMTVINGGYWDMALKIVSSSAQKTRRFVYVRSGERAVIKNLPRETCLLRWESGTDWDANSRRFLGSRAIHQFDQIFDLRRVRYTIDFTPSIEGTLRETSINESDFEEQ